MDYLPFAYPNINWTFINTASNGYSSWTNLILLNNILSSTPSLIVVDPVNDDESTFRKATCEGLVRRIKAALPNCRIVFMKFFTVSDHDDDESVDIPTNQATFEQWDDITEHYSIQLVDFWKAVKDLVDDGAHLNTYLADTVHPTADGHTLAFNLLRPYLMNSVHSVIMPTRLYSDSEYFEETIPNRQNGTDYTSKTGTWTESGTQVSSSEAGATITFTGSFKSFAIYRVDPVDAGVQYSIDGGAFVNMVNYPAYGWPCNEATTVTFKVISGTVIIDEVWLI